MTSGSLLDREVRNELAKALASLMLLIEHEGNVNSTRRNVPPKGIIGPVYDWLAAYPADLGLRRIFQSAAALSCQSKFR